MTCGTVSQAGEIFTKGEQRLNQREEQYDLLRVQTNEFGDPRWWKGVDNQDDGADGRPDLGIHLGVFLAEGRLEDRCVQRVKSCLGVEPCLPLGSCTFWKLYNDIQSMFGEVGIAIQKLDSCNGIDEESSRSVTQYIDVFVTRPPPS
jgi:hypothetical protein